jgi:UDP-N-acetylmuramyl tripeptide synthase
MTVQDSVHRSLRSRLATGAGRLARGASRALGRGSGGMIGGEVALALDPRVLAELAAGRRSVTVTGTNGKSTTTRMVRAALAAIPGPAGSAPGRVASNTNGDNMPSGIVTALMSTPGAPLAALEVDEMHLPVVARDVDPEVMVLLNLSRDQLDRVGEIGTVERRLREAVLAHPESTVVANCDDPLIASAAWDSGRVVWVAAGSGWGADSVGFPRGGRVVRDEGGPWRVVADAEAATGYRRPDPDWWLEDADPGTTADARPESGARAVLRGPDGVRADLRLSLPGRANLGNAAQAVAAAVSMGARAEDAAAAVGAVREVAGRYAHYDVDGRDVRMMLAKNPAGWQEALTMVDADADQVVVAVNGQVADGQDLSWLWDVDFAVLETGRPRRIIATGERGADLGVRMEYAGLSWERARTPMEAIARCRPGHVELLANYTAFRDLRRALDDRGASAGEEASR